MDRKSSDDAPAATHALLPAKTCDLPRIDLSSGSTAYRPTVLVGVGRTAGYVLSNVCRRIHARFGGIAAVPAIQMLLIDTDPKDLAAALYKRGEGSLPARCTLGIPLRSAKDYRSEAKHLLEWLSRRWLYNIPRSLQTEGLRPLGRLAFVDHSRTIQTHLKRAIETATSQCALDESRQASGLDFRSEPPNIFLIASLAGGTGSGVVLDLSYAVRKALAELELPDQGVCGLLLHSTSRKASSRDLAVPCALACLQELKHYSGRQGCYPGDPDCDLPAFYGNHGTFHSTYLVHLGNDLGDREFESATDRVAEYLYQNALTPATAFFDQARRNDQDAEQDDSLAGVRLRTIGLGITEPASTEAKCNPTPPQQSASAEAGSPEDADSSGGLEQTSNSSHETDVNLAETHLLTAGAESGVLSSECAAPLLQPCGGARRTLVLAPPDFSRQRLFEADSELSEASTTFIEHGEREMIVCQEIQDVPLENVVAFLTESRPDYLEIADRLHTRIDVEWAPLLD